MRAIRVAVVCAAMVAAAGQVQAGAILSPTSVVSNTLGEFTSSFAVANLINQSGLSAGFASGVTDFDTYLAGTPTHLSPSSSSGGGWASAAFVISGTIVFDLGAAFTLSRMALWNDTDAQAIGDFTLAISNDVTFASSTSLGSFSAVTDPLPVTAQVFSLTPASGRFVRLNILGANANVNLVNSGELAFDATPASASPPAVPEPSTFALLGIGAVCLIGYRRTRKRKAA